ncbi:MAG: hypothetical protein ACTSPS_08505, partial [Promethearchaeota archaeon]
MKEKKLPKYQIQEKTPEIEEATIDKTLLKKIVFERRKLEEEKKDWEGIVKKIEGYNSAIKDLEQKRKIHESEVRSILNEKETLNNELGKIQKE